MRGLLLVNFGIKSETDLLFEGLLLAEPFILEAVDIPLEVAKDH